MKVVVANASIPDLQRTTAVLASSGHVVSEAPPLAALRERVEAESPAVAIIDWAMLGARAADVIGALRRSTNAGRLYVIASSSRATPADFRAAEDAAIDDFLRLPACPQEILMRVRAPERIATWAAAPAEARIEGALAKIQAWNDLEALVAREIGEVFGIELAAAEASSVQVVHASTITISLASDGVEIRLALGVDAAGTETLVSRLLGGDGRDEVIADALRELANTAAGAFKRAALADGARVAIGIPSNDHSFSELEGRRWKLLGADGSITLACSSQARGVVAKRIRVDELREGMVVVRDVRSVAGALLVPAGTYLTSTTADRLGEILGPAWYVEVGDADGGAARAA